MAMAIRSSRTYTDADLMELARLNPAVRFERGAEGELIVSPPSGSKSGMRDLELGVLLSLWNRKFGHGVAFGSAAGFLLPDSSVFSPDASWVNGERWGALTREQQEGFAPIAPDLVFEIASPSDSLYPLNVKMRRYLANGTRAGVLIDPFGHSVDIYTHESVQHHDAPASITIEKIHLAGADADLVIDLAAIQTG